MSAMYCTIMCCGVVESSVVCCIAILCVNVRMWGFHTTGEEGSLDTVSSMCL